MNRRTTLPALLAAAALLLVAAPSARALSVFVAGPSVLDNYPPNNLLSMRVVTTTTSETSITWGLQGGNGMSTMFGTVRIPAGQFMGFDSKTVPLGYPPGVYTLYATEAGTTRYGRTFGKSPDPPDPALDDLARDVETLAGPAGTAPGARANLRAFVQGLLLSEPDPARRARLEAILGSLRSLAE